MHLWHWQRLGLYPHWIRLISIQNFLTPTTSLRNHSNHESALSLASPSV